MDAKAAEAEVWEGVLQTVAAKVAEEDEERAINVQRDGEVAASTR